MKGHWFTVSGSLYLIRKTECFLLSLSFSITIGTEVCNLDKTRKVTYVEHHSFSLLRIYWSHQIGKVFENVLKSPLTSKRINTFFCLLGDLGTFLLCLVELRNLSKFRYRAQYVLWEDREIRLPTSSQKGISIICWLHFAETKIDHLYTFVKCSFHSAALQWGLTLPFQSLITMKNTPLSGGLSSSHSFVSETPSVSFEKQLPDFLSQWQRQQHLKEQRTWCSWFIQSNQAQQCSVGDAKKVLQMLWLV